MTVSTTRLQIAELLPRQGEWTEEAYLWLSEGTKRLVELSGGQLEVLPMPTQQHQDILAMLFDRFRTANPQGKVYFAPLRLRLSEGLVREPDLLLLLDRDDPRRQDRFWLGADLVVEIVSPSNRAHDLVTKRADYARAGIPEYWIVDPEAEQVQVLALSAGAGEFAIHGAFHRGDIATSPLLPTLRVDVSTLLDVR